MATLLFELFSEEIPARMQVRAARFLVDEVSKALQDIGLPCDTVRHWSTPRRLALRVEGLPESQPDRTVERKGPKTTAPQAPIDGFCRSTGLAQGQLQVRGDTYFSVVEEKGKPTSEALVPVLEDVVARLPWPKSMRWGAHTMQWARPLVSVLALLDDAVLAVRVAHITASNTTQGHRFLAPERIVITHPDQYESALEKAYVLADRDRRKAEIIRQADALAAEKGLVRVADEGLLEEVVGLVEWPNVLLGTFDRDFLALPQEVPILEMKHHQRYFALRMQDGALSNHFLITANITTQDGGAAIVHGNQRVLRARLSDGRFYWDQDRKKPLAQWLEKLSDMVFHAKVGSMQDKVEGLSAIAADLAPAFGVDAAQAARVARLSKADLATGMVGEFPELQGMMGYYYAQAQGMAAEEAEAIRDHYKPLGPEDDCPSAPLSVVVALADKLYNLVELFKAGEAPTGSKDPFALRRAALGVIRLLRQDRVPAFDLPACAPDVHRYMVERLRGALKDEGMRPELLDAVVSRHPRLNIKRMVQEVHALAKMLASADGANLLAGYTRAANILTKEEKKEGRAFTVSVDADLLHEAPERHLRDALDAFAAECEGDFEASLCALAALRAPVDAFFADVLVNAPDEAVRLNRLSLPALLREQMNRVIYFPALSSQG